VVSGLGDASSRPITPMATQYADSGRLFIGFGRVNSDGHRQVLSCVGCQRQQSFLILVGTLPVDWKLRLGCPRMLVLA
jgi:hypothetical protein